ncbi:MAG: N-formylglutamate amidohydrolase, partial [Rhodobacteraceae bacterium]|nr:N-formylglutamate amidohydrolase [Paracoccaceae bacterium]
TTHARFGEAVLIDCHSMPHEAIEGQTRHGQIRPDVVLGDRFGAACAPDVVDRVEAAFASAGLRVARNTPFAGAFVSQSYGRPSARRHVLQIEIDRALYLDEQRIEPLPRFAAFHRLMAGITAEIANIGRPASQIPLAAE